MTVNIFLISWYPTSPQLTTFSVIWDKFSERHFPVYQCLHFQSTTYFCQSTEHPRTSLFYTGRLLVYPVTRFPDQQTGNHQEGVNDRTYITSKWRFSINEANKVTHDPISYFCTIDFNCLVFSFCVCYRRGLTTVLSEENALLLWQYSYLTSIF